MKINDAIRVTSNLKTPQAVAYAKSQVPQQILERDLSRLSTDLLQAAARLEVRSALNGNGDVATSFQRALAMDAAAHSARQTLMHLKPLAQRLRDRNHKS